MSLLNNKNILLGLTGGIAAYKGPDLVRKLTAMGANVRVVLTRSAKEFVSPLSLQAVSGNPIADDLLDPAAEAAMGHIELAKWADILLIAPCSANFMAKLSCGLADDLLSTLVLATTAQIYIAPAMNQQMWKAAATQSNLSTLESRGIHILGPASGEQACGDVGPGRMPEPQELADMLAADHGPKIFNGQHIIITAGPTREDIDPVRYLSNHSSGKMGFALAEAAHQAGATVTLITGPVSLTAPAHIRRIDVVSAAQMHDAVMANIESADIFIGCAAVADYRPLHSANQKIKKTDKELTITFERNPDILATVASLQQKPFTVGFAAETRHVEQYARGKLNNKKLDMIAANDVSQKDIGFNSQKNALHVYWSDGETFLNVADKLYLARQLINLIAEQYKNKHA